MNTLLTGFGARRCYHSATHNMLWILSIFGTAIGLSKNMNPTDYENFI